MFRLVFESLIGVCDILVSALSPAGRRKFHPCGPGHPRRPDLWQIPE